MWFCLKNKQCEQVFLIPFEYYKIFGSTTYDGIPITHHFIGIPL